MINTPVKGQKAVLTSDFASTYNEFKTGTKEKRSYDLNFNEIETPKRCQMYIPIKDRILRKEEFRHVRNNRARLIDWYLEIFATYGMDWDCFWLTIELVDSLIADFNYVDLSNIHLVGIVCCFICAKFMGKKCLTIRHVEVGLGHRKFS